MRPPNPLKGELIAICIIILFHLVGLIGLLIPSLRQQFLQLVPYHLLLMTTVVLFSHQNFDRRLFLFVLCIFVLGYTAEWIGVNKHLLFGNYQYGQTLGFQLGKVPLIIGVNWFLLIYAAGVFMQRSRIRNMLLRVITGAIILVLLDILIEPVAMHLDYWHWLGNVIPQSNYYCWFFVSAFMLVLFEKFHFKKQGIVGPVLLVTQFVFFAVLHWL
ncbi:MAG TPA: carotenoid biosynthesis protein [Mucilaginibacter sp.]|jgi:putative membrane protein